MTDYRSISIEELLARCVDLKEADAWQEFIRRFHCLIASVVLRTSARFGDRSAQVVDDLIQETYLKLCSSDFRILRSFSPTHAGSFLGFIKVIAANVVRDHFKASSALKRALGQFPRSEDPFADIAGGGAGSPIAIEQSVLIQEIQKYLDDCTEGPDQDRNRTVFWLYYRAGLSAAAIAAIPSVGLSTKGVESVILRTTRELRLRLTAPKNGPFDEVSEGVSSRNSL